MPAAAGQATAQADDEKSRNIFVCGVVQQAMNSGKFTASEIAVLTAEANRAFDLIGEQPEPSTHGSRRPSQSLAWSRATPALSCSDMNDGATILLVGDHTRRVASDLVQRAPEGWRVTIDAPKRTLKQSSRFWATCDDVAKAGTIWGNHQPDKQDWHDLFLSGWNVVKEHPPAPPDRH